MLKLSEMFTSHAVLQRERPLPVWGRCAPGAQVEAVLGRVRGWARAGEDGSFRLTLPALPAGGPYDMTVSAGEEKVTLTELYVGEVWIAGGQSNMEAPVCCAQGAKEFLALAPTRAPLRLKTISRKTYDCAEQYGFHFLPESSAVQPWREADADALARFSAIGAAFGRALAENLDIPVGVISCNFGATKVQPWVSPETIAREKCFAGDVEAFNAQQAALGQEAEAADERFQTSVRAMMPDEGEWLRRCLEDPLAYFKADASLSWPPDGARGDANRPACLWEHMLSRLFPYACRGVIWYQGESSAGLDDCGRFKEQTRAMIADWRAALENDGMWFIQTQLAPYDTSRRLVKCDWPLVREAQRTLALEVPLTLCAPLTGLGQARNIHPVYKLEAAGRLSALALEKVYGRTVENAAPEAFPYALRAGADALVPFLRGEGLHLTGPLTQLETSADGARYHAIAGRIDCGMLRCEKAENFVRFGYAPIPEDTLQNGADIPAGPFVLKVIK